MILQKVSFQLCGQGCCPIFKLIYLIYPIKLTVTVNMVGWPSNGFLMKIWHSLSTIYNIHYIIYNMQRLIFRLIWNMSLTFLFNPRSVRTQCQSARSDSPFPWVFIFHFWNIWNSFFHTISWLLFESPSLFVILPKKSNIKSKYE